MTLEFPGKGNYVFQGVSPAASLSYKPVANMTIYGTFASSLQAPDVANAGNNINELLPPYRSKEGEVGYKLNARRIIFTAAMFRINRRPYCARPQTHGHRNRRHQ